MVQNKIGNLFTLYLISWQDNMAPTLKKLFTKISQKDLNLRGKTSDKLLVLIGITIAKDIPIMHLKKNKIIQEGIVLRILPTEIVNKLYIIIFFLTNLFVKKPETRLPRAINNIKELDIRHPLIELNYNILL